MQGLDAQSLSAVSDEILQAVDAAQNLDDLENVRINALGKKGRISLLMRELGGMDADARIARIMTPLIRRCFINAKVW